MKRFEVYRPRYVDMGPWFAMLRPWRATLDGVPMDGMARHTAWVMADARRGVIRAFALDADGGFVVAGDDVVHRYLHGNVEIEGKTAGEMVAALRAALRGWVRWKMRIPVRGRIRRAGGRVNDFRWSAYQRIRPEPYAHHADMGLRQRLVWMARAHAALAVAPWPERWRRTQP